MLIEMMLRFRVIIIVLKDRIFSLLVDSWM